ncbi:MAG TPA: diaminopimelate epimerase [Longimicrobiales bacterium]|nr:diaminopimelate epimerase [Longimicrobiales bacterium]
MPLKDLPRPKAGSAFYRAHGLGNDYVIFDEGDAWTLTPKAVERVCDRYFGMGSDGLVLLLKDRSDGVFRLRMFNPDGGEFERSGNGLRCLGSYLAYKGWVDRRPFVIEVAGDRIPMTVHAVASGIHDISVDMGQVAIGPAAVALDPAALDKDGRLPGPDGRPLDITAVCVGNPHVVVWSDHPTMEELKVVGPFVATHPAIANGTNMQLAKVVGSRECRALIWERGVGHTWASGTSSCAVATAAVVRKAVEPGLITVHLEGGDLRVNVTDDLRVELRGPVEEVAEGTLTPAFVANLAGLGA